MRKMNTASGNVANSKNRLPMGYFSILCLAIFIALVPLFFISVKTFGKATIMSFIEAVIVVTLTHFYFMLNNSNQDPFYFIAIFIIFFLAIVVSLGINFIYILIKSKNIP